MDMKRLICLSMLVLLPLSLSFGQFPADNDKEFIFSLYGAYGLPQAKGSSVYSDTWSGYLFTNIIETTDITYKAEKKFSFGGSFSFFFTRNLGI